VTARIYTDMGFFTDDPVIGADVSNLFNALTGYSRVQSYQKLVVSPGNTRQAIIHRIDREIELHKKSGNGKLVFKMNALVDKRTIKALYRASQAGIPIHLQVRGICCLRPGVPGVSENVTVTSVVGRFLEHVRIYYFGNDGDDELLIGSADLMPRNLDKRVETLFPIDDGRLKVALRDSILNVHLRDTVKARQLLPDGNYERIHPAEGEAMLDSQSWMIEHRGVWHAEGWT
jgi:polyphosphate kinase